MENGKEKENEPGKVSGRGMARIPGPGTTLSLEAVFI